MPLDRTGLANSGSSRVRSLSLSALSGQNEGYIYRQYPPLLRQCGLVCIRKPLVCVLTGVTALALVLAFTTIISHGRGDGKPQRQLIRRNVVEEALSLPPEPYPREAAHQSSGCSGSPQRRFMGFRSSSEAGRLDNNIDWPGSRQGRDTDMETINCGHTRQA